MVLLLDTSTLPPKERNEALSAVVSRAASPMRVTHDVPDEMIRHKMHYWNLGPSNGLIRSEANAVRFTRTARDVRADDRDLFAVTYQHRGRSVSMEHEQATFLSAGRLSMHNVASAHDFAFEGKGENASFLISHGDLGMPVSVVLEAVSELRRSPLYDLVRSNFAQLSDVAQSVSDNEEAAGLVASATVDLIRALVASIASEDRAARTVLHDTAPTAARAYAAAHLHDPDLDAERIAPVAGLTVKELRRVWADDGDTFEDWLRTERARSAPHPAAPPRIGGPDGRS